MDDIVKYQQSIAAEFAAQRDRVRYFIGSAHWGEDGRYKEIILADFLRTMLPSNVSVGTGFVKNRYGELTNQIDIIIYRNEYPRLFNKGDFVILAPESVLGIVEVKSTTDFCKLSEHRGGNLSVIEKCEKNGRIIGSKKIFNGIWSYDSDVSNNHDRRDYRRPGFNSLKCSLRKTDGYLNHISFNSDLFCRYWAEGNPRDKDTDSSPCFSFYNLSAQQVFGNHRYGKEGLSFGYFISNLLEMVYQQIAPQVLSEQYYKFLYPLENTKEDYRISNMEINTRDSTDEV